MAVISVSALAMVDAPPEQVRAALADYREVRPAILPADNFSGYEVVRGGQGAGSQVRWTLNPAKRRKRGKQNQAQSRDWDVSVEEVDGALIERDSLSSTVTTWTVVPVADGRSVVKVELSWDGPSGVKGLLARSGAGPTRVVFGEVLVGLRDRFEREARAAARAADPPPDAAAAERPEQSESPEQTEAGEADGGPRVPDSAG